MFRIPLLFFMMISAEICLVSHEDASVVSMVYVSK